MAAVDLPYLRYFRAGPKFNFGVSIAPDYLGDPNDLENSEDCRSAGGHGNQHVRLRCAQIDGTETICPARQRSAASSRGRRLVHDFKLFTISRRHFKKSAKSSNFLCNASFLCTERLVAASATL